MTPPRVCPQPPDCPLYDRRLAYAEDESLRRAVLMERRRPGLADLLRDDVKTLPVAPHPAALPPARESLSLLSIELQQEGNTP